MFDDDDQDAGNGAGLGFGTGLTLQDHVAIAKAPKLADRPGWGLAGDVLGKVWNAPNTALGLFYGGAGMAVGEAGHLLGLQDKAPSIGLRNNAVQFMNNPFGGQSAITIGNTTTWNGDPYDPTDRHWHNEDGTPILEGQHTNPEHEKPHTYQGQELGPFYLPSNLFGGLNAMLHGEDWHGPHNWNERGPQMDPPRPWPWSK